MSLIVAAILAAGSFVVGRRVMRSGREREAREERDERDERDRDPRAADGATRGTPSAPSVAPGKRAPRAAVAAMFAEFPCTLGDVILRTGGDEAWLAGAVVFSEEVPVSALFVAPDAGGDHAIFVRPRPNVSVTWLRAVTPSALDALKLGAEPPSALELDGLWFERTRRLPVRAERVGTGAPDVGEQVIVAEYAASGVDRVLVVAGPGVLRAWRGVVLEDALYEVIASGTATLDPDD